MASLGHQAGRISDPGGLSGFCRISEMHNQFLLCCIYSTLYVEGVYSIDILW